MKVLIKIFVLGSVCLFFGCNGKKEDSSKESEIEFRYYNLENQGWKSKLHSEKVDNIKFTATEVPIQYYLLKEMGNTDLVKVDSVYEENKRERVIEFTFEGDKNADLLKEDFTKMDYQTSVKYMSFTIEKDFKAVVKGKDTITCSGVLFERNFKVAPFNKVLLFFSGIDPNDKIQLIYQDKLFQKGILKFNFTDPPLNL